MTARIDRIVPRTVVEWVDPALVFAFDVTDHWSEPPDVDTLAALIAVARVCEQFQREREANDA
jgi:hypothetical protein